MLSQNNEEFRKSIETGFIDKEINSDVLFQPELLVNHKQPPKKVLSTVIDELNNCEAFYISVAFVTSNGVATLMNTLQSLVEKGIAGKILVSDYLKFTEPEALRKLLKFSNIELKISTNENSHSKGYIFKSNDYFNLIIGSSNLTANALSTNKEWNLKVSGLNNSSIVEKVFSEFKTDFSKGKEVTPDFIENYSIEYDQRLLSSNKAKLSLSEVAEENIKPNSMQIEALENLKFLRSSKKEKALLISATGTGKTFLSAFDAKEFNPKKLLFVVHRLNIAKKSMESFRLIFGNKKTMGLYSGNNKDLECDFIFSTVQTISKEDNLQEFSKNHFDYIIIDESHRAGADSYLRLIDYFKPKFLLGMTATPERTDGVDIFSLYDHNIAYEIRLNRAMEEDMLSQFHYFGITDIIVDEVIIEKTKDFSLLATKERVSRIIEKANFYGCDNGIIRGLVFCSRTEEAKILSEKFNNRGFKTIALTGGNSELERENAIELLESDDLEKKIDYIFTVDIFNEGVDIPRVNQILMIRPTESAIIFVQQLGRGLRKTAGKGFLTIVDFIGNYNNNYLIPVALFGDASYNKDTLRKLMASGSNMIPGASTINFDEITKERIFQSIDSANMQQFKDLKNDFNLLKYKLGRIPMMVDFLEHGSRDPNLYVVYSKSYYNFICRVEPGFNNELENKHLEYLELFSKEINNAKRIEESIILKELIENSSINIKKLKEIIKSNYGYHVSEATVNSCINNLNFKFVNKTKEVIIEKNGILYFSDSFTDCVRNSVFLKFLLDNIIYSISTFNKVFKHSDFRDGFILYQKYTRKDVCRILNWEKDESSTVYGYRIKYNTAPLFVTYKKSENISNTTKYNDHFISPSEFAWESKSNRNLKSKDVVTISESILNNTRLSLFIQKSNDEGKDFYFMGDVLPIENSLEQSYIEDEQNQKKPVVHFRFLMSDIVQDYIYKYIVDTTRKCDSKYDDKLENGILKPKKIKPKHQIELNFNKVENLKIPLYNFHAAAGQFSEMQYEKDYDLISVPEKFSGEDYFACKIVGESMNRRIPNGSTAIFKIYSGGSRNGKIMLIENMNKQDPDFNSQFTVKTYSSQKSAIEDGWEHGSIVLRPNSYDSKYKDIVLSPEEAQEMRTVGEFVGILESTYSTPTTTSFLLKNKSKGGL